MCFSGIFFGGPCWIHHNPSILEVLVTGETPPCTPTMDPPTPFGIGKIGVDHAGSFSNVSLQHPLGMPTGEASEPRGFSFRNHPKMSKYLPLNVGIHRARVGPSHRSVGSVVTRWLRRVGGLFGGARLLPIECHRFARAIAHSTARNFMGR